MKFACVLFGSLLLLAARPAWAQVSAPPPADSLDRLPPKGLTPILNYWGADRGALPEDKGIVYGGCVQRLGFSSGGFQQYVRLYNLSTGKAVNLEVKPAFRSARYNTFCYALPPGRYALVHYQYTESKWYGGETHTEPLRKAGAAAAAASVAATRYVFTVTPGKLHYLGTWHFDKAAQPRFANSKAATDEQLRKDFKKLPFEEALVAVPE
jgi:hypothetical protein